MDSIKNIDFRLIYTNKYVQLGGIIFIVVNIIILNIFVFIFSKQPSTLTRLISASGSQKSAYAPIQKDQCASCESQLTDALIRIQKIELTLSTAPKITENTVNTPPAPTPTIIPTATPIPPTPTPTRTITGTPTPTVIVAGVKEYYISFGSGNSSASGWTDVSGLQTSIDTMLYPTIKTATFEVGGHTPTGNETIWVRLYNATDNYPVANSDITWVGGGNQYIISNPITLASGNKTYKVQMKTQLSYTSYIDSAKIHLILY